MTGPYFVDTNVLVYARDEGGGAKQNAASAWLEHLWISRDGRISTQVLQELYNVLTRKLSRPVAKALARADVVRFLSWDPLIPDGRTFDVAFAIEDRYQLSWWDSLIVAAAQQQGCRYLLSEDLQAGQDFDGVTVLDPFQVSPSDITG